MSEVDEERSSPIVNKRQSPRRSMRAMITSVLDCLAEALPKHQGSKRGEALRGWDRLLRRNAVIVTAGVVPWARPRPWHPAEASEDGNIQRLRLTDTNRTAVFISYLQYNPAKSPSLGVWTWLKLVLITERTRGRTDQVLDLHRLMQVSPVWLH